MAAVISMAEHRDNEGFVTMATPFVAFGRRLRSYGRAVQMLATATGRRAMVPAVDVYALSAADILSAPGYGPLVPPIRANDAR